MPEEIVLTADDTLMSDYRRNEFLGFGTCAPSNFIPDRVYRWLFFPPIKTREGAPLTAPYGLRKIEAQLLNEGFSVATVAPAHLGDHLDGAKVLGVHVMDPFGLGPASSTLASILKKEPFLARYFQGLMNHPKIRKAKGRGLKIIVGGPGTWQFRYRQEFVEEHGIDCVVEGEAEKVVGNIVKTALDGGELPKLYEASIEETPSLDEIPDIVEPSINGLVEIGRGCCRGCRFCSVTVRPLRWYPYEKIMREIDVNRNKGNLTGVVLHAEDVMLYGSDTTLPHEEKLLELHELASKRCDAIFWSHCSLATVAAKPKFFSKVAETILQKQGWWGAEIGIETGSPELAKRIMPAKAHPFKPEEWPDVVRTGMGVMHDNKLVPAGTLIVGSPDETDEDVLKTIELLDDIRDCRSLIVPLFFVPMGRLKDKDWFKDTQITELHEELLVKCVEHDFRWVDDVIDWSYAGSWYGKLLRPFYGAFARIAKLKVRKAGIRTHSEMTRLK